MTSSEAPETAGTGGARLRVAFFASDGGDAVVIKRLMELQKAGCDVTLFCFERRRESGYSVAAARRWPEISLGRIGDRAYLLRLLKFITAFATVIRSRNRVRTAGRIHARSLDMALLAVATKLLIHPRCPLSYEVLDIRPILHRVRIISTVARFVERLVLSACDLLVVSSEAYMGGYFKPVQHYGGRWLVMENKLAPEQIAGCERPHSATRVMAARPAAWRLGWFGMLKSELKADFAADFAALAAAASRLGGLLQIELRGMFNQIDLERVEQILDDNPHVHYEGPYDALYDLPQIYCSVDLVWCGDFSNRGLNGSLLMPNRIYEAGFFGVPIVLAEGTYAAAYAERLSLGWTLSDLSTDGICQFFCALDVNDYNRKAAAILRVPAERFVDAGQAGELVSYWQEPL